LHLQTRVLSPFLVRTAAAAAAAAAAAVTVAATAVVVVVVAVTDAVTVAFSNNVATRLELTKVNATCTIVTNADVDAADAAVDAKRVIDRRRHNRC
jgi:hypothetical protein